MKIEEYVDLYEKTMDENTALREHNRQLRQENDRLEKRVSILEETVRRKQYEVGQVKDRLDRLKETCNIALDTKEKRYKILQNKLEIKDKDIEFKNSVIDKQDGHLTRCGKELMQAEEKRADMQYEIDQQNKDIETLKAEILHLNKVIVQLSEKLTRAVYFKKQFREAYDSKKKVIRKMSEWIHKKDVNCTLPVECNYELVCEDCIIKHFESEVKE